LRDSAIPSKTKSTTRWPETAPPLRSLLFVPGGRPDRFEKARGAGADAVIYDLEDSVPESGKAEARRNVAAGLASAQSGAGPLVVVRINPASTRHWRDDLRAVVRRGLDAVLLPKCSEAAEITSVDRMIASLEREQRLKRGSVQLFLLIETPGALLHIEALIRASLRVSLLAFGPEDFSLATGTIPSADESELLYGRSLTVIAATAYGCLAVDGVHMQYADIEGLIREAERDRRIGFTGKLVVHPMQIEPVHRVFAVTEEELTWAQGILKLAEEMDAKGVGAAGLEGQLVDAPVVARARRIVASAGNVGRRAPRESS
jgi:citrate lyase subunit beta/citryl-CoA lyase